MKERELREASDCAGCGKKFGHTGVPFFWRVKIQRYALNHGALERQRGLEMMMGAAAPLAQIMGPNEDMAEKFGESVTVTLCETCSVRPVMVAALVEGAESRPKKKRAKAKVRKRPRSIDEVSEALPDKVLGNG